MTVLNEQQIADYHRDGFVFARGLFTADEIEMLGETARNDHAMDQASSSRDDGQGNDVRLSLWNHPGEGVYGMFARCHRVVDAVEQTAGSFVAIAGQPLVDRADADAGGFRRFLGRPSLQAYSLDHQ